ncbi:MAG TPA: hypothetical protein ENN74_03920, partial [Firmicutes bacterium]|nr:hypothetical protein [Bacillota bacterium]
MSEERQRSYAEQPPSDDAASPHGAALDWSPPGDEGSLTGLMRVLRTPATWLFLAAVTGAFLIGKYVPPTWSVERITLDVKTDEPSGQLYYTYQGQPVYLKEVVPLEQAELSSYRMERLNRAGQAPKKTEEFVYDRQEGLYYQLLARRHWRFWSLLPALTAVVLCWVTREPLTSLFGGIVVGAFILGRYNITESVLVANLATPSAAGVLVLYLWLLGGLMGIWARTGAARAFAEAMTKHVVRGRRSAKLVSWLLGIIFFQGGSISTVLVGTTVKPLADRHRVSHEELAYIVDSTA